MESKRNTRIIIRACLLSAIILLLVFAIADAVAAETEFVWTAQNVSALASILLVIVGIAAGCIAFWYTRETKLLREQGAIQVQLLRDQVRSSSAPYFLTRLFPLYSQSALSQSIEDIMSDTSMTVDRREKLIERVNHVIVDGKSSGHLYICLVRNPTNRIAYSIVSCFYSRDRGSYLRGDIYEVIDEYETLFFSFGDNRISIERILDVCRDTFGQGFMAVEQYILPDQERNNLLLIIFRGMDGRVYLFRRTFYIDETGHLAPDLGRLYWD